ncbi:rhodanese-like domain-containing protein [Faucicola mancuniensis]|uniref:rhodanese-like domain-containing protein n=1 Tax=Faucicola mancuniensis TaxID=1309795 RepID=UPI003977DD83
MIRELHITDYMPNANDTIWDVRDNQSFNDGHIEFAKNQPLDTLNADLLDSTEGTIYVLCGGGTKAGKAVALLNEIDPERDIVHLTGGTRGAKSAGMTIISEEN